MTIDQRLKNLIEKSSFLTYDEKGFLIAKLPSLSLEKKQKLIELLINEESKIFTLNLKYAAVFQTVYIKWQNTFDQISKIIS
ncbi:MAG: hypothetical protein ACP5IX_01380 [Patescibacteria group bacterium]